MRQVFGIFAATLSLILHAPVVCAHSGNYSVLTPQAEAEARSILQDLIRLDTQNPPGNESLVAHYIADRLAREGISFELLEPIAGRASIVARLKGDGSKRPLLLLGHEDVVPVERDHWSVDPFGGTEKNGLIYGSGAFDDKGMVAANLEILLELKRRHVRLARDVIFLAEAAEEAGGPAGMATLIERYWGLLDCEFALNEGEGAGVEGDQVTYMTVATVEKVARRVRLVATGTAGHGSVPRLDNAVTHLAAAVATVGNWKSPARLNETTRAYIKRRAGIANPVERGWFADPLSPASQQALRRNYPPLYSMVRTSVVPTMLTAGVKVNVIPSTAEAHLDIRAMPDEDVTDFYAALARVINDSRVEIVPDDPVPKPAPPASSLNTVMFLALEYAQHVFAPGAITLPIMTNGGTDSNALRAKGVQA